MWIIQSNPAFKTWINSLPLLFSYFSALHDVKWGWRSLGRSYCSAVKINDTPTTMSIRFHYRCYSLEWDNCLDASQIKSRGARASRSRVAFVHWRTGIKKTRIVSTLPPKPQKFPESTMSQRNICLKIRTWNRKNSGPIFAQMHQICLDQNLYFLPLSNFDIFVILAIMIFWSKTYWSWMTEP